MDLDYFLQGSTPLIRSARIRGLASPNAGSASQQQLRRRLPMATGRTPDTYASVLTSHRATSDAPMDLSGPGASTDAHDQHVEVRASDTPSTAIDKDADWTTALTLRQGKQQALERKRANAAVQDASKTNSHSVPKKKKSYKLPPLPKDDFKIIIRPHQGLPLRNIVSPALAAAIIEACDHHITGEQFLLRIKPGSNIAILSTPHQEVVYYYGGELVCHPFRATVQVCKLCRVRGHRTDVCPHPDRRICRMCGLENPSPQHPCELNCASCGGPHATGDRSCTKRLKKPRAPRTSRPQAARQPRWFSTEDEEEANGKTTSMERRTTSCSRSRSRSYSKSAKRSPLTPAGGSSTPTPKFAQPRLPQKKKETPAHHHGPETSSTAMPEVSRVGVASGTTSHNTPITLHPEYKKVIAENKQLRETLDNMKSELALLRQQMATLTQQRTRKDTSNASDIDRSSQSLEQLHTKLDTLTTYVNQQLQLFALDVQRLKRTVEATSVGKSPRHRYKRSAGHDSDEREPKAALTTDTEDAFNSTYSG
ncbi:hypothetical protein HPB52_005739 [Rhipicephalus sanguineus]|uniref:Uncharacterized protein n=1 Tax=Rhipicephalus sanguineus TaxID=34632 RepID=A0A9D4SNT7_RHISA|nr:hypothetical protein HPB52_005739 [Rhipicephalus sanguineus]